MLGLIIGIIAGFVFGGVFVSTDYEKKIKEGLPITVGGQVYVAERREI